MNGKLGPEDFPTEALKRPKLLKLMARSEHEHLPMGQDLKDMSAIAPDRVLVRLWDGRQAEQVIGEVRGGPLRPMTHADILAKFQTCGGEETLARSLLDGDENVILREAGFFTPWLRAIAGTNYGDSLLNSSN